MSASVEPLLEPLLARVKLPPLPLVPACPAAKPCGDLHAKIDACCAKPPADAAAPAAEVVAKLLLDALRETCGDMPSSNGCMRLLSPLVSTIRCCAWCCCCWWWWCS
jgi:hypothetical protein